MNGDQGYKILLFLSKLGQGTVLEELQNTWPLFGWNESTTPALPHCGNKECVFYNAPAVPFSWGHCITIITGMVRLGERQLLQSWGLPTTSSDNANLCSLKTQLSLLARDLSPGGTCARQRQKLYTCTVHTNDENQYLHNQFGSHRVPNVNLFNFMFLLIIVINVEWLWNLLDSFVIPTNMHAMWLQRPWWWV